MKALPLFLCVAGFASAQPYTISTVAGNGPLPFGGGNAPAVNARLVHPFGVAADSAGNVFISDQYCEQVFKVTANGIITVYAGNGVTGFLGDKGPAVEAQFTGPGLMVADPAGNLYIADTGPNRVRRVTLDGKIDTV